MSHDEPMCQIDEIGWLERAFAAPSWSAGWVNEAIADGAPPRPVCKFGLKRAHIGEFRVTRGSNARRCCAQAESGFLRDGKRFHGCSARSGFVCPVSVFVRRPGVPTGSCDGWPLGVGVIGIAREITKRKEMEKQLIASAIALMALRRSITGHRVFPGDVTESANLTGECTTTWRRWQARRLLTARSWITANTAGGNAVEVAGQDSGLGLGADLRARMFDPYFSTKPQGLGIVLSISRSIIKAHGGCPTASVSAHRGTTLRFTLPLADGADLHGVEADRICG